MALKWSTRLVAVVVLPIGIALLTVFLTVSPENLRQLPEMKAAIADTARKFSDRWEIDKGLTGDWVSGSKGQRQVILSITCDGGQITGEMRAPALTALGAPRALAFVEGKVAGQWFYVDVYEIKGGRKTMLAKIEAGFQRPVPGSPTNAPDALGRMVLQGPPVMDDPDNPWKLVDDVLKVYVNDQARPALPPRIQLRKEKVSGDEIEAFDGAASRRWFNLLGRVTGEASSPIASASRPR